MCINLLLFFQLTQEKLAEESFSQVAQQRPEKKASSLNHFPENTLLLLNWTLDKKIMFAYYLRKHNSSLISTS